MYANRPRSCQRNDLDVCESTCMRIDLYANRLVCESTCMRNDRLPTRLVDRSVTPSLGRKLLFVFPMTNAQLYLTKRKISLVKNHRSRRLIGRTMLFTSEKWSYGKPRHAWRENWEAAFLFSSRVGKVCGCRFSWQFYCKTRKQSHITNSTTRCKRFENLFRNQEWT